jgi:Fic family protein
MDFDDISQFEPLLPAHTVELEELARELVAASARLEGRLSPLTLEGVTGLVRIVNSYYSNLIEGHDTRPIDIQRAMRADYFDDPAKRDLQTESLIHIDVQELIAARLRDEPETNVAAPDFLLWIHREFYQRLPESLRWVRGNGDEKVWVDAGRFRERFVKVGEHIAPSPESIGKFLKRYAEFYDPASASMRGFMPVVALVAAHHRLMWIHPFLDGNGRVARLFTDAFFTRIGFAGYGLWNVSRGLARKRGEYRSRLAAADEKRDHDYDGRGHLSDRTLTEFCRFFLEACLDQTEYMNSVLELSTFLARIETYVGRRNAGLVVDDRGKPYPKLAVGVGAVLKEAAVRGRIARGEVARIIGMSERTGRNVLKNLLDEGLLNAENEGHKSAVRLGFPVNFAALVFPELIPGD